MIFFLVNGAHRYTIDSYLKQWAGPVREVLRVVPYEELRHAGTYPGGVYIFSDIDRLTDPMRLLALQLHEAISKLGDGVLILNHPTSSLRRFELLQALHQSRQNRFCAHRVVETTRPHRFPVFLRLGNAHVANLTPLLHGQSQVDSELRRVAADITAAGYRMHDLLMVDYLDTSDRDGVFRRYAADVIADRIIPRSLFFSRNWVVKSPELLGPEQIKEEARYVETDPHHDELRKILAVARIQYGRVDYSVLDGRIQVWEANTNPEMGPSRRRTHPQRLPVQERFVAALGSALMELSQRYPGSGAVSFAPAPAIVAESLLKAHRPPEFFRPPPLLAPVVDRMPAGLRRALRPTAVRLSRVMSWARG